MQHADLTQELLRAYGYTFDLENWTHPVREVLQEIDYDTARRKAHPEAYSIWEILVHMLTWTKHLTATISGSGPDHPDEDWPMPDDSGEASWQATITEYLAARETLRELITTIPSERWLEVVNEQYNETPLIQFVKLMIHHSYHIGQIEKLSERTTP